MPEVLTMASEIKCSPEPPHGGKVAILSTEKLSVQGKPVLVTASVVGQLIAGCNNSSSNTSPCTNAGPALGLGSTSTKLSVNGVPVLLATLSGSSVGTPGGTLAATANQNKLTAI